MSFGYPNLRPHDEGNHVINLPKNSYGIPDTMTTGFRHAKDGIHQSHPLEYSEKHWTSNKEAMDLAMLRNMQGMHMPLRLKMEQTIASKMQRLPCLASSNIMLDTLTGRNTTVDFEDVFNVCDEAEVLGHPHVLTSLKY
ncbi:proteasome maturation protein [Patella vulgata]|uniref:proteasome maturation protein n=1 Tax=Patella vulgata TaxID=6465 RepID=UPI00217F94B9|nr:proteasome maturation protein [Patella vulgata]